MHGPNACDDAQSLDTKVFSGANHSWGAGESCNRPERQSEGAEK